MKFILKCIVLIVCAACLDAFHFRCDYRYTYLGWFKYHEIPETWQNARLQCHFEGGILASPTTAEIKSFMLESFCKPDIFTGIHSTFSKGYYYTIDGIPLSQIPYKWSQNEPDNKDNSESCLAMNFKGELSDVRCDEPRPYICYRENSDIDVNVCGTTDPEYYYSNQTMKCYKFHSTPRTFSRAHFACSAEGGNLAVINSEDEMKFMKEIFAKYPAAKLLGNYWKETAFIGFHTWGESADWTTLDGQSIEDAGYAKFNSGQPDNATTGEYCGSMLRTGFLHDLQCELHFPFICEKEPHYPEVCDNVSAQNTTKFVRVCDDDEEPDTESFQIDVRSAFGDY